ncbi:MAG: thioredoxin family protein [Lentisphaeria bacterium]|nr:thioredoxin family protein [Lentisphaeria bacterium]
MSGNVVELLNEEAFVCEVENDNGVAVVDFWGDGCAPCKTMSPIIEELANHLTQIKVCKINFANATELAVRLQLMGLPTFYLFKNGEQVASFSGTKSLKEFKTWIYDQGVLSN